MQNARRPISDCARYASGVGYATFEGIHLMIKLRALCEEFTPRTADLSNREGSGLTFPKKAWPREDRLDRPHHPAEKAQVGSINLLCLFHMTETLHVNSVPGFARYALAGS
jgi:hypothetical protein